MFVRAASAFYFIEHQQCLELYNYYLCFSLKQMFDNVYILSNLN